MPEDEFIGLMQICDAFDLVKTRVRHSQQDVKSKACRLTECSKRNKSPFLTKTKKSEADIEKLDKRGTRRSNLSSISNWLERVRQAHDVDVNLSVTCHAWKTSSRKASEVFWQCCMLLRVTGIAPDAVDYVIDCCEEACGDMNQRGGGNFAKSGSGSCRINKRDRLGR